MKVVQIKKFCRKQMMPKKEVSFEYNKMPKLFEENELW